MKNYWIVSLCLLGASDLADAEEPGEELETVVVEGRRENLVGQAMSASEGLVNRGEIEVRPLLRTGEILELVPGMVVTQHSGTGKANQYFLRGFNLDHGTDFATTVNGMPVNMRTHGHGQGYTDLNFIIPETVKGIAYKKGAYYADVGDFSGAGAAELKTVSEVEHGMVELTYGQDSYYRLVTLDSLALGAGEWLYALEANVNDGPWSTIKEDLQKFNVLSKYSREIDAGHLLLTVMAYDNQWNSADQIPSRAVDSGMISELGTIDDTVGGNSSRYSFSVDWSRQDFRLNAYMINYDLQLWSNFTYFMESESAGDQFEQFDKRWIYGGSADYTFKDSWAGLDVVNKLGVELRYDDIDEVGLYQAVARRRTGSIRNDRVKELSAGVYWQNQISWSDHLKSLVGLRHNYFHFDVDSLIPTNSRGVDLSMNSGNLDDSLLRVKGSVIYEFNSEWEAYVSAGQGFHSNDARGTTIAVDPADGSSVDRVDALVESFGYEVGLRGFVNERLNTSAALWVLDLDSELLFVGDAGNTEPSGKSKRQGFELTAYYRMTEQWTLDMEYAYSDAEFTENAAGERDVPGAIGQVIQAGLVGNFSGGWFGSIRYRYFGKRPLLEDGSIESDASSVVNFRLGYQGVRWSVKADILNLFDSNDHDIDYFYASRLDNEPSGESIEDIHYHVLEPRTVRVSVRFNY